MELLKNHNLYVVPVVNVDGYAVVSKHLKEENRFVYKRKNNNKEYEINVICGEIDQGVDLNRNYDWSFGYGEDGSSSNPCA